MRCKVRVLQDIKVGETTIPGKTLLVIDDDHVVVWPRGTGAPVKLRSNHVAITFSASDGQGEGASSA